MGLGGRRSERCGPPVCAARRPWKGQGKVTGSQGGGKSQELLNGISTAFKILIPLPSKGVVEVSGALRRPAED